VAQLRDRISQQREASARQPLLRPEERVVKQEIEGGTLRRDLTTGLYCVLKSAFKSRFEVPSLRFCPRPDLLQARGAGLSRRQSWRRQATRIGSRRDLSRGGGRIVPARRSHAVDPRRSDVSPAHTGTRWRRLDSHGGALRPPIRRCIERNLPNADSGGQDAARMYGLTPRLRRAILPTVQARRRPGSGASRRPTIRDSGRAYRAAPSIRAGVLHRARRGKMESSARSSARFTVREPCAEIKTARALRNC
jgi:hypothetical protein